MIKLLCSSYRNRGIIRHLVMPRLLVSSRSRKLRRRLVGWSLRRMRRWRALGIMRKTTRTNNLFSKSNCNSMLVNTKVRSLTAAKFIIKDRPTSPRLNHNFQSRISPSQVRGPAAKPPNKWKIKTNNTTNSPKPTTLLNNLSRAKHISSNHNIKQWIQQCRSPRNAAPSKNSSKTPKTQARIPRTRIQLFWTLMRPRTYAHSKMAFNKLPKGKMKTINKSLSRQLRLTRSKRWMKWLESFSHFSRRRIRRVNRASKEERRRRGLVVLMLTARIMVVEEGPSIWKVKPKICERLGTRRPDWR